MKTLLIQETRSIIGGIYYNTRNGGCEIISGHPTGPVIFGPTTGPTFPNPDTILR